MNRSNTTPSTNAGSFQAEQTPPPPPTPFVGDPRNMNSSSAVGQEDDDETCVCKDFRNDGAEIEQEPVPWPIFPGTPTETKVTLSLKLRPCLRALELLPGKKWHPDGAGRASSYEAALAYCVGVVADASCGRCIDGIGPFAKCIVVPGLLGGVCAGCKWAGCAEMCSFNIKKRTWKDSDDTFYAHKSKRVCEEMKNAERADAGDIEAVKAHCAYLEAQIEDLRAEQDRSRLERASIIGEAETLAAAVMHLQKKGPQMVEIDGAFCVSREKAVAIILALQCILWDLES